MERSLPRVHIIKDWRFVVVEYVLIFSVVDTVQGQFDTTLVPVVARWRLALGTSRVVNNGRHTDFQVDKATVDIWRVVNLVQNLTEGVEVTSFKLNHGAARFGSAWWDNLFDRRPIVVPEVRGVA